MRPVSMASSWLSHGFVMAFSWLSHGFASHRSQGIFVLVIPPLLMSVGHFIPCPVEYFGGDWLLCAKSFPLFRWMNHEIPSGPIEPVFFASGLQVWS